MAETTFVSGSGTVTLQGTETLKTALDGLGERAREAAARILFQEGERIMAVAKGQTPVDTGALRASGQVSLPTVEGSTVSVELGFGNSSVNYAVFVHENLQAKHPVGKAKYLEDPVLQWANGAESRLAGLFRGVLDGRLASGAAGGGGTE